ncbi:MAG TPA: DUF5985 family protein [Steroidobacteraceae bacterium]|jgi:hypothetical protein|nr:DUF5985 family protein [Steroidobacteraceae bacterium]
MLNGFLLGTIVTASLIAGAFFIKFWRQTRDTLFLAFGASFIVEGLNRSMILLVDEPNLGHPLIYLVRLLSYLLILIAIIDKNRAPR